MSFVVLLRRIIAYLIWKGSYNHIFNKVSVGVIIAYLIWKGSYNRTAPSTGWQKIIAYLIGKEAITRGFLQTSAGVL